MICSACHLCSGLLSSNTSNLVPLAIANTTWLGTIGVFRCSSKWRSLCSTGKLLSLLKDAATDFIPGHNAKTLRRVGGVVDVIPSGEQRRDKLQDVSFNGLQGQCFGNLCPNRKNRDRLSVVTKVILRGQSHRHPGSSASVFDYPEI
ncbi:hypothetical protein MPH_10569 [Macrophomina phaseolina MS6]|uniref:Uncharacterized protein n=1 Tax=Macrophomina phaseolina (strain MS6) TaxID=1126212 RepID=K2RPY0_MACPH|nr:hypothetical protein MPH_10569 [Macrophomina phaseolina MS6]